MLKLIHLGSSGIQTHDICLVTGSHNLPKSAILKTYKKRICLMIANRYWLDVSSQFQGLLEETEFVIGFQLRDKASVFDNIDYVFKNYFI